jgi:hypothetical protein
MYASYTTFPTGRRAIAQERAGETTLLAVAHDVAVTTSRGERELTFVGRVVG